MRWETRWGWARRVHCSLQCSRASSSAWLCCSWACNPPALLPVPAGCTGIIGLGKPRGELGWWRALLHGASCTVPGANLALHHAGGCSGSDGDNDADGKTHFWERSAVAKLW